MAGLIPDGVPDTPFASRVAALQSEIQAILDSEVASGGLQYSVEGIHSDAGGSWNSTVWKPGGSNKLDIECREVDNDAWRVMVIPKTPEWPARFLDWPTEDFEAHLRDAVATLRSSQGPADVPPVM